MKRFLTITTALCLAAATAHAGNSNHDPAPGGSPTYNTATQTTIAAAAARALAAAQSRAVSRATGGAATAQGGTGGRAVSRSAGGSATGGTATNGNQTMNYSGGGYSARGNNVDAIAPSIITGNDCALPKSGGVSFLGIGVSGGFANESEACMQRKMMVFLVNTGDAATAREMACQTDDAVRRAAYSSGHPCARDARGWAGN